MAANALEGGCHPSVSLLPAPIREKAVILLEDPPLPIMAREARPARTTNSVSRRKDKEEEEKEEEEEEAKLNHITKIKYLHALGKSQS